MAPTTFAEIVPLGRAYNGAMRFLAILALSVAAPPLSGTVLQCGKIIDVETLEIREEASIEVRDGEILRVVSGYTDAEGDDEKIDLTTHTCMPGWMDMHVHLTFEISPKYYEEQFQLNPADYAFRAAVYARKTLLAGFTTVRDVASYDGLGVALKRAID